VAPRSVRHTLNLGQNEHVSKRYQHYLRTEWACHLGPRGPIGQARMGSCDGEKMTRRSWYGAAERVNRSAPRVCSCVWMRAVGSDGQRGELRGVRGGGEERSYPARASFPHDSPTLPHALNMHHRYPGPLALPELCSSRPTVTNQDTPTLLSADLPMLADQSANTQARTYIHKKFNHRWVPLHSFRA
jgi:hypothetical protein